MTSHSASCACGKVEIAFNGAPIAAVSCCCDDCQAAAASLEALPGAPVYTEPCGGTPAVLFASSAMRILRGADRLSPHRLRDRTPTKRMVATCCNSALYIGFDRGPFWVTVVRARMGDSAPAPRWRIQTRFLPAPPPNDIKNHPKYPAGLIWRIALARVRLQLPRRH